MKEKINFKIGRSLQGYILKEVKAYEGLTLSVEVGLFIIHFPSIVFNPSTHPNIRPLARA